jgi:membrane-associated phospholipid phosphatase
MTFQARVKAKAGLVLLLTVLALGWLALTAQVTHDDLRVDLAVRPLRFHAATTVFTGLTNAAAEAAGLAVLAAGIIVLLARRRRWDAARLFLMAGSSWALALAVKDIINRPRPPASLWLIPPDSAASFPSGHDTTAIVVVLIVFMALAGTGRLRIAGTALAVVFALAVGASRVYLGDHYPTDVLGSYLTVAVAVLLASAFTDLLWVRRLAARLLRSPGIAPAPARNLPAAAGRRPAAGQAGLAGQRRTEPPMPAARR